MTGLRAKLAQAALPHVPFDGWSEATLVAAAQDVGIDPALARVHLPRGGADLALEAHRLGDERLRAAVAEKDLSTLRFRERITELVMMRLEAAGDREVVRAASSLLSLPHLAAEGARAIWQTADLIWTLAGDQSTGFSHYSKRMTLSAVYGATVLYWLGDDSEGAAQTRGFLERRIASVMRFEQAKADLRRNPLTAPLQILSRELGRRPRAPGSQPEAQAAGAEPEGLAEETAAEAQVMADPRAHPQTAAKQVSAADPVAEAVSREGQSGASGADAAPSEAGVVKKTAKRKARKAEPDEDAG